MGRTVVVLGPLRAVRLGRPVRRALRPHDAYDPTLRLAALALVHHDPEVAARIQVAGLHVGGQVPLDAVLDVALPPLVVLRPYVIPVLGAVVSHARREERRHLGVVSLLVGPQQQALLLQLGLELLDRRGGHAPAVAQAGAAGPLSCRAAPPSAAPTPLPD